jgi:putative ABC transport system permease protein
VSWWRTNNASRHGEAKLDAELRDHLERQVADYMRAGMSEPEARRRTRLEFGGLDQVKEYCRDVRPTGWLDHFWRDVRYAGRSLRKNPRFATAVVLTLALAIGANTAIFSVAYSVLLKPLPYVQPEQIYSVEVVVPERREQLPSLPVTVQAFLEWRKTDSGFAAISALTPWECNLTGDAEPEHVGAARVSANFFSFLGVPIARGRDFNTNEERPGNERVVVISDSLWRRRYGSDPSVIGRTIVVNGENHSVIGIAPPSLLVPTGSQLHPLIPFASRIDIWKPIAPTPNQLNNESWDHGVLVRNPKGANVEHGRQQLEATLNDMIRAQLPGIKTRAIIQLVPMREIYAGKIRPRLMLILAASALLLLTACASIANLFLARVASRSHEFATRIALGAGRARILSQTLTETIVVAMFGGAIGALLARYGSAILGSYGPGDVSALDDMHLNVPALAFAMTASLITGILCGVAPAWQTYTTSAGTALQEGSRASLGGGRAARARQVLVGVEIALGTALLASTGLLLHSFVNVMGVDRGYQIEHLLAVALSPFGDRYSTGQGRNAFYRAMVGNVRALPGVLAAGAISALPAVSGSTEGASRTIFYETDANFRSLVLSRPVAMIQSVTAGYFAASGSSLRAARLFAADERAPSAVINETLARRLWPMEYPSAVVGHRLRQGDVTGPLITVVGVVQDARPGAVDREPPPVIYRPHEQWSTGPMSLVVKTATEPAAFAPAVRAEIRSMDPNLPIPAIRTMREIVSSTVAQRRFQLVLIFLFALVALLLGAVGVYGVVSYSVASRTRDIGLRIALGALRIDVIRWVFSTGMQPVLIGLVIGLGAAIGIATVLRSLLFGITPTDPLSFGIVVLVLLVTSGVACYLPARRAAALDPMTALRHE